MADPASFARLVPGFDFLQSLMKGAGDSLPGMGQWIAPSLDPEEIDKRIRDLRTVQFWLEQNAKMIGATIQALEVQRMTLNTLQGMNVPLDALREAMTMKPAPAAAAAPVAEPPAMPPAPPPAAPSAAAPAPAVPEAPDTPLSKAPGVDPMAWWGALTQQFGELAANAMKDLPAAAAAAAAGAAGAAPAAARKAAAAGRAAAPAAAKPAAQAGKRAAAKAGAKKRAAPAPRARR